MCYEHNIILRPGNTDCSLMRNVNLAAAAAATVVLARPRTASMSRLEPRRAQIHLIKEHPPPFELNPVYP